jgi:putative endonuclease
VDGRDKPGHDSDIVHRDLPAGRRYPALRMTAFVYIMSNRRNGVLYTGVTTDLPRRAYEHREGLLKGFTRQYGLKRLVYYEAIDDVRDAIQREKNIKHWPRAWKVRLVHVFNPEWADLYESLF